MVLPDGNSQIEYVDIIEGLVPILGGIGKRISMSGTSPPNVRQKIELYVLKSPESKEENRNETLELLTIAVGFKSIWSWGFYGEER